MDFLKRLRENRVGRRRAFQANGPDGLEPRQLLAASVSAPLANVTLLSAAPDQGRGVVVSYKVDAPSAGQAAPVTFAVYRSADERLDATDVLVGASAPQPRTVGDRQATVELKNGLTPYPEKPYVITAVQSDAESHATDPTLPPFTAFRTHSIAVVSHGGIQNPDWASVPRWEGLMVNRLRQEGYDTVIPFNWVSVSNKPGYAMGQGRRMAKQVVEAAAAFPDGEPVDIHLIGHSQGAVVVSQAIKHLEPALTPELDAGFIKVTLLDPHGATTGVPGQQYSTGHGPIAWIAKGVIDSYQSKSDDPAIVFPDRVNEVEVFYQHSPASKGDASNRHIYNLWGQVPLRTPAVYFDLTQAGVTHAGSYGVPVWYQRNVVPTLGEGAPEVNASVLTGALSTADAPAGGGSVSVTRTPTFEGHAAPGSTVRLLVAAAADPAELSVVGRATADGDGNWSLTSRPLPQGRYRVLARSVPARDDADRIPMVPTAPLGALSVRLGRNG